MDEIRHSPHHNIGRADRLQRPAREILKAAAPHDRSFDVAPKVHEGETVAFEHFGQRNSAWFFGRNSSGIEGYFPSDWFDISEAKRSATALRCYDAMELSVKVGDLIQLDEEYGDWVLVSAEEGRGWIPRSCIPRHADLDG